MRTLRFLAFVVALLLGLAVLGVPATADPPAGTDAGPGDARSTPAGDYTVETLHFRVRVGPDQEQLCDVVGDLYLPEDATGRHRAPAILTTNGFGGSKDDQTGIGEYFAGQGYVVLSYSGLGFGGSGCKIHLDSPAWDGQAARQLVSFLGGAHGIAYTDKSWQEPRARLDVVRHDRTDHTGRPSRHDPRVGMIGGSYGGHVQFAAASIDPRIDTLVPMITWNDLSYSLAPNNTDLTDGVDSLTPGAVKLVWGLGFSALGVVNGLTHAHEDPARMLGCPNFADFVCPALLTGATTGFFGTATTDELRSGSVTSFVEDVRVPTLLMQGQADTLFNLNEAAATYEALRRQGTEVSMVWQSWGHSDSTPLPGELDLSDIDPATQYQSRRVVRWFQHHLEGRAEVDPGPRFSYYRPWVEVSGDAEPAYATSDDFPVGEPHRWFLSGRGELRDTGAADPGSQSFLTPPAGLPTSFDPVDVIGNFTGGGTPLTGQSLPGTSATWRTAPLTEPVHVAGMPTAELKIRSLTGALTQLTGSLGQVVLFLKVVDIAPDGTRTVVGDQIAPVRVSNVADRFEVTMPGIVHRFEKGHRIALVVAGGSPNYRGNVTPATVTIDADVRNGFTLPIVSR